MAEATSEVCELERGEKKRKGGKEACALLSPRRVEFDEGKAGLLDERVELALVVELHHKGLVDPVNLGVAKRSPLGWSGSRRRGLAGDAAAEHVLDEGLELGAVLERGHLGKIKLKEGSGVECVCVGRGHLNFSIEEVTPRRLNLTSSSSRIPAGSFLLKKVTLPSRAELRTTTQLGSASAPSPNEPTNPAASPSASSSVTERKSARPGPLAFAARSSANSIAALLLPALPQIGRAHV